MSIAVVTKWQGGMTEDDYLRLNAAMDLEDSLPWGCETHIAGVSEDGHFIISDVWESQAAFEAFVRDRLEPTCDILSIDTPDKVTRLDLVRHSTATSRVMT